MAKTIDKQTMLDLIVEAKRTDPETGSFAEWLAEYLAEHLPAFAPPNEWVSKEPNAGLTDFQNVEQDTIDAIKMLRAELEQVQRERDAAVEDLRVCSMGDLAQSKTACCIRAEYVCAGVTTGCSATLRIPKSKSPKFCIKMGLLNQNMKKMGRKFAPSKNPMLEVDTGISRPASSRL